VEILKRGLKKIRDELRDQLFRAQKPRKLEEFASLLEVGSRFGFAGNRYA
jgi:hypothetical protein